MNLSFIVSFNNTATLVKVKPFSLTNQKIKVTLEYIYPAHLSALFLKETFFFLQTKIQLIEFIRISNNPFCKP